MKTAPYLVINTALSDGMEIEADEPCQGFI